MSDSQPKIATNRDGEGVADALNSHLGAVRAEKSSNVTVCVASAFFNPEGFRLLADELEEAAQVRLLLGADPQTEPRTVRSLKTPLKPERAEQQALAAALEEHNRDLFAERDLLGFSVEASETAQRLISWLRSGKVEVRQLSQRFLHGKAFIVEAMAGASMVGSSNFTYAGLAKNLELNLFTYEPEAKNSVSSWFTELWESAEDFDLAAVYESRFELHKPKWVYLRMLWEQYQDELAELENEGGGSLSLTMFSRDAVWRANHHIAERGGVLLADDVGLGKTFQAGDLIIQRVREKRQRVLVIAPAVLRDGMWREFMLNNDILCQIISFDELAICSKLNPEKGTEEKLWYNPEDYAMVVIDEAHNLRNPSTQRAEALRTLLSGTPAKDVVLITATPVNNSLWDVYHLLRYFIRSESEFSDVGVASMYEHFNTAMAIDPEDLTAESLFEILDAVSVRRTRNFIKRYYPNDFLEIEGERVEISFPTPRQQRVSYEFSDSLPGIFDDLEEALNGYTFDPSQSAPEGVLAMARYSPSMYRNEQSEVDSVEVQNAGLLRSMLLKRFESSTVAFANTCRTMADSHLGLLEMIQNEGKVATGQMLADWLTTEGDDEEVEQWLSSYEGELDDASNYDSERLCEDLIHDQELLLSFAEKASVVTPVNDPKLAALVEELVLIIERSELEGVGEQDTGNKRKVLLFSYFADTVDWIFNHLVDVCDPSSDNHDERLVAYHGRIVAVSGKQDRKEAMYGFAPETTSAPEGQKNDLYDVLIATDVLAEGVNLQQARHVINYDLPWNPQKLTQRHGRVDRLRSPHTEVFIRSFFPSEELDRILNLETNLQRKMRQAVATFGGHDWISGGYTEVDFAETHDEILLLEAENSTLFEGNQAHALGGEEFRQELRQLKDDAAEMNRVMELPWGSGSGFVRSGGEPGYVFCARVGDHPRPQFRYIPIDPETGKPKQVTDTETGDFEFEVEERTLTCLAQARPFPTEISPSLPQTIEEEVFVAWEIARDNIFERWIWSTDPANLTPAIPKAMRDAEKLVLENPSGILTVEEINDLSARLLDNYPNRITRAFRKALNNESKESQLNEICHLVELFGLAKPQPVVAKEAITLSDIHLVCWMAIQGEENNDV